MSSRLITKESDVKNSWTWRVASKGIRRLMKALVLCRGTDISRHKLWACWNHLTRKYWRCQKIAKIINFPKHTKVAPAVESSLMLPLPKAKKRNIGSTLIKIIWILTVLLFPLLELFLLIDCVFQFFSNVVLLEHKRSPCRVNFCFAFFWVDCTYLFCCTIHTKRGVITSIVIGFS